MKRGAPPPTKTRSSYTISTAEYRELRKRLREDGDMAAASFEELCIDGVLKLSTRLYNKETNVLEINQFTVETST